MKTGLLTGLVLSIFVLASCNETQYQEEIKTVDYLLSRIDSAEKAHANIDTSGIADAGVSFKKKFTFVSSSFEQQNDTLNRDAALLISNYRDLKKPYANFVDEWMANAKELEFSKKQLIDLRHDLEHNLLDTNFVTKMVVSEQKATEAVVFDTRRLERGRKAMVAKNDSLEPKIDSLITKIKSQE